MLKKQGTVVKHDEIETTIKLETPFGVDCRLGAVHGDHSSKINSFTSEATRAATTPEIVHARLSSFLLNISQEKGIKARPKMKW